MRMQLILPKPRRNQKFLWANPGPTLVSAPAYPLYCTSTKYLYLLQNAEWPLV